jgi:hypothetical protein
MPPINHINLEISKWSNYEIENDEWMALLCSLMNILFEGILKIK